MKPLAETFAVGRRPRVAVIGSGVAGLTSAWLLQNKCDVHIYEPNAYAGGHTRTIQVAQENGTELPVDMGFIVMNHRNYPCMTKLLVRLGVALGDSDMSFSYHEKHTGYAYCGSNLRGIFARPANLLDARHWAMLKAIVRFNKDAEQSMEEGQAETMSLGEFIDRGNYGPAFAERYLLPMSAAIWSTPLVGMRSFPAASLFRFFRNHGLLSPGDRPQWRYVKGGSQTYVRAMLESFQGELHLQRGVTSLERRDGAVTISLADGRRETFDFAVVATHADQALTLLRDPTEDEKRLLGPWRYQANSAVLHTDTRVMPRQRAAWASWNAVSYGDDRQHPVALSYHMNRLQRLTSSRNYLVSLNMDMRIDENTIIHRESFTHPTYTFDSMATQAELPSLNGVNRTFYCGSYFGYGFHEDAIRSAVDLAGHFEVAL